ncbi:hypothetical protein ONZ45_g7248 [Pleurotus djamor]|nr:hypothetical protein ONZ45_g7248 [Pleurotus djamor]
MDEPRDLDDDDEPPSTQCPCSRSAAEVPGTRRSRNTISKSLSVESSESASADSEDDVPEYPSHVVDVLFEGRATREKENKASSPGTPDPTGNNHNGRKTGHFDNVSHVQASNFITSSPELLSSCKQHEAPQQSLASVSFLSLFAGESTLPSGTEGWFRQLRATFLPYLAVVFIGGVWISDGLVALKANLLNLGGSSNLLISASPPALLS